MYLIFPQLLTFFLPFLQISHRLEVVPGSHRRWTNAICTAGWTPADGTRRRRSSRRSAAAANARCHAAAANATCLAAVANVKCLAAAAERIATAASVRGAIRATLPEPKTTVRTKRRQPRGPSPRLRRLAGAKTRRSRPARASPTIREAAGRPSSHVNCRPETKELQGKADFCSLVYFGRLLKSD